MKRVLLNVGILIFLFQALFAQNLTSYYEIPIRSKATGKLVTGLDVDLYQNGIKKYDLSESTSTPGVYFHSTVAMGEYDIWVNSASFKTGVFIGANKLSEIAKNWKFGTNDTLNMPTGHIFAGTFQGNGAGLTGIGSGTGGIQNTGSTTIGADTDADGAGDVSLQTRQIDRFRILSDGTILFGNSKHILPTDTTDLKNKTAAVGQVVYLPKLSATSSIKSGAWYVYMDSTYLENGGGAFGAGEAGKQWVALDWFHKKRVYPEWWGAVGDSVVDDSAAIQKAYDFAIAAGGGHIFLPGKYLTTGKLANVIEGTADHVGFFLGSGGWIDRGFFPDINSTWGAGLSMIVPLVYERFGGETASSGDVASYLRVGSIMAEGSNRNWFQADIRIAPPLDVLGAPYFADPNTGAVISNPTATQLVDKRFRRKGPLTELMLGGGNSGNVQKISWRRNWNGREKRTNSAGYRVNSDISTWSFGTNTRQDSAGTDNLTLVLGAEQLEDKAKMIFEITDIPTYWGTDTLAPTYNAGWDEPGNYKMIIRGPLELDASFYNPDSFKYALDMQFTGAFDSTNARAVRIFNVPLGRVVFSVEPDSFTYAFSLKTDGFKLGTTGTRLDSIVSKNDHMALYNKTNDLFYALEEAKVAITVTNGDMELSANWVDSGTPPTSQTRSSEQAHGGTYSWKVVASAVGQGIMNFDLGQTTAGKEYKVSGWFYPTTNQRLRLHVRDGGGTVDVVNTIIDSMTANQWNYWSARYTEITTGVSGYIALESDNAATFYLDDVTLDEGDGAVKLKGVTQLINATAPTASQPNASFVWAEDINSSSEFYAQDEAGNTFILTEADIGSFTTTATVDTVLLPGVTTNSQFGVWSRDATPISDDQLSWTVNTDTLFVRRVAGTTSGLQYNWKRFK